MFLLYVQQHAAGSLARTTNQGSMTLQRRHTSQRYGKIKAQYSLASCTYIVAGRKGTQMYAGHM
jgi:hypothetical protein